MQPDEQGDVVLGVGQEEALEHPVAELGQRQVRVLAERGHQLAGAGVDVPVAALDQAVGVEQHVVPRVSRRRGPRVHVRRHAQEQVGGHPVRAAPRRRRRSIRIGAGWPALDQRNHVRPARRSSSLSSRRPTSAVAIGPGRALHGPVQLGEDLGRRAAAGVADPAQQAAHLPHRGGGPGVVAGDVTDGEHGAAVLLKASYQSPPISAPSAAGT